MHTFINLVSPHMDPCCVGGQEHLDTCTSFFENWSNKKLRTKHELEPDMRVCVRHRIVWEDEEHMSGNRPPHLVCLLHEGLSVEGPGLEDDCHVEEV